MKKIFTFFLVITSILYIYIFTYDKKIYYLSISNEQDFNNIQQIAKFLREKKLLEINVNQFNDSSNRIIDYLYKIEDNDSLKINNKKVTFKNALVKSDVITISLVEDDDTFTESKKVINYRDDLILLLTRIREYSKEDIFFVGLDENKENEIIKANIIKVNNEIKEHCENENIVFINYTNNYYNDIISKIKTKTLKNKV